MYYISRFGILRLEMEQYKNEPKKSISWLRKRHVLLGLSVALILVLVVFAQVFYPVDKTLPFARIADSHVGNKRFDEVAEHIRQNYADVSVTVTIPNREPLRVSSAQIGITPGYRDAARDVTEYSLTARLVPFSFVYKMLRQPALGYEIDTPRLDEFVAKVTNVCAVAPKDARIIIKSQRAAVQSDSKGQRCETKDIRSVIQQLSLRRDGLTLKVKAMPVEASYTSSEVQTLLPVAASAVNAGLTVRSSVESWVVTKDTIAGWLGVAESDGKLILELDEVKVTEYLEGLRGKLYVEQGTTVVSYEDGTEVGKKIGNKGQGIDPIVTVARLQTTLLDNNPATRETWVGLTIVEPKVEERRTYTSTDRGLQAMIEQWDKEKSPRFGIIVRDLSGKNVNAQLSPDADFVTSSTYKMFLAYAVLHKVEISELSMDTTTDIGLSVRACIDEMILHSTNACATALLNLAGWNYVHTFIREQFPNTSIDNGATSDGEKHTTVRDEANFLIRLTSGQLMMPDSTNYLLGLMKRQIYRSGIPKGVPGVVVANKVGFYSGYKHDVGIIYSGRGTYVLAILSYGSNDGQFADLSRRVAELMP